jgi:hypothetical protein
LEPLFFSGIGKNAAVLFRPAWKIFLRQKISLVTQLSPRYAARAKGEGE